MPLNASGTISVGGSTAGQSINLELNRAASAASNLNESALRTLAGIPSGIIRLSNFYGKSNGPEKGYTGGKYAFPPGDGSADVSAIDGLLFSTEAASNPSATLSVARGLCAGTSSNFYGYFQGGFNNVSAAVSEIDGIDFSTEASRNPTATLTVARGKLSGLSSSTVGYTLGGATTFLGTSLSEVEGLRYADEVSVNPSNSTTTAIQTANVQSSTAGYMAGGTNPGFVSVISKFLFFTEVTTTLAATMTLARRNASGFNSTTNGYFCGGYPSGGTVSAEIDGLTFATEAATNPAAALSVARYTGAGVASLTKGYVLGGALQSNATSTEIDGIQFSNDAAINPAAVLTNARYGAAGVQG